MPTSDLFIDDRVDDRHIHGEGTPEHAWRGCEALQRLKPMSISDLATKCSRVVVVAPHPDDEVLGCGGALALLARAGHEILVVGVTDGEAGYPGSAVWTPTLLARQRRIERADGLERLGLGTAAQALGVPDGAVTQQETELTSRLLDIVRPDDTLLATWRLDGHPDHEASGRAAATVAADVGCSLWEFPVWMWHWASPGDARVPWPRMRRLALDDDARDRKSRAIAAHDSQLVALASEGRAPVLPDWALARLLRPFEVFIGGGVR